MKKLAMMFILCWSAAAGAVPTTINFTGRLTTSAGPVTGAVNLTLKLYDVSSGGTPLWIEDHGNVGATNGLVFVDAGALTTLDEHVLDGRRLYLEITVGTETLAPRLAINSVPYAVRAGASTSADLLGASIGPSDVVTSVSGANGVAAVKSGNAVTVGLSSTGCASGQVLKYNGTTFACAADTNTTYTGGNGIAVNGTTINVSTTGCSPGFVWKYNGTTFACAPDADTTYSAGNGIGIAGTTISVNSAVVPLLAGTNSFSGINSFTNQGNSFSGNGAALVNLNANNLGSGSVPPARVSGDYAGITSVGTLGGLAVSGAITRGATGAANLVPIAYGSVGANGVIASGASTSNFTVSKGGTGDYNITIAGGICNLPSNCVTIVSAASFPLCGIASVTFASFPQIAVLTFACNGASSDQSFSFVTYRP